MYTKNIAHIIIYYTLLCSTLQRCNSQLLPPLTPLLPPLPLIPGLINFLDRRISQLLPAILNFKNTIISDPLGITNTWVGPDICNYTGFYCDSPPDNGSATALAAVDFNGFSLGAPSLDGFIDRLSDLALFHANSNNFSGTISPRILQLKYLYELDLSNNKLTGDFPKAVLDLPGLSFLDLRFNSFTGALLPGVFVSRFDFLFLNDNDFTGKLPENLGSTRAGYLTLANNRFSGSIPRSIGNASETLIEVLFLNNRLSGCVPAELGRLRKATVIDASENQLTGYLPSSLGCLEKAEILSFAGNSISGTIPEPLCSLKSLQKLNLSYNYISNIGPICRKLIGAGVLDVNQNCISGLPNQRSQAECSAFSKNRGIQQCPSDSNVSCGQSKSNRKSPGPNPRSGRRLITYSALHRHRLFLP